MLVWMIAVHQLKMMLTLQVNRKHRNNFQIRISLWLRVVVTKFKQNYNLHINHHLDQEVVLDRVRMNL
jgi:hypothetical protein